MRVLSIAYPFAEVGTGRGGGAEQILAQIDAALVSTGCQSFVLAAPGSRVAGVLLEGPAPPSTLDPAAVSSGEQAWGAAIGAAIARVRPDVTHLHAFGWERYAPPLPHATVATLHLPVSWCDAHALRARGAMLVAVSARQARDARAAGLAVARIDNGVPVSRVVDAPGKDRAAPLVWLARVCPEKAPHEAIAAAKAAGVPLRLGGHIQAFAPHLAYARTVFASALDAQRLWLGPRTPAAARRMLQRARALLVTSRAPETSCLVAMEAAAAGTPVIAFPSGAVADIVRPGETGWLVKDAADMAAAIGALDAISPGRCLAAAHAAFDSRRMTRAYLALYAALTDGDAHAEAAAHV